MTERDRERGFSGQRGELPDLVCLSHLRWNFVFQRPQHLMTRFAERQRVFFVEEPIWEDQLEARWARMEVRREPPNVTVAVPHLPSELRQDPARVAEAQRRLLDQLLKQARVEDYVLWYYTPMALDFSRHLTPRVTMFDCMDELSAFAGAPPELRAKEAELLAKAHVVTTGGRSLFEAKRDRHPNIHCFPSSVDLAHFRKGRDRVATPPDQADIPRPRLGYAGVIDERMDLGLLEGVAAARPDWHLVMLGPVVKIDPATLPKAPNIHYLGMKTYNELPTYMAGWDVAMLPFARNESTRFISPTKTPEYLAAGRPVVSTSIRDVVSPYGVLGLTAIADDVDAFVEAAEQAMTCDLEDLRSRADEFLTQSSWDQTAANIQRLMEEALGFGTSTVLAAEMTSI